MSHWRRARRRGGHSYRSNGQDLVGLLLFLGVKGNRTNISTSNHSSTITNNSSNSSNNNSNNISNSISNSNSSNNSSSSSSSNSNSSSSNNTNSKFQVQFIKIKFHPVFTCSL